MTAHAVRDAYAFSPDAAVRMWARNATVARRTILVTLVPRFLEAIAYLAIMGLGLGTYLTTVEGVDYVDFIAPGVARGELVGLGDRRGAHRASRAAWNSPAMPVWPCLSDWSMPVR